MKLWQQDLYDMAQDMDKAVSAVEEAGFDVWEYKALGFPREHQMQIVDLMHQWNSGSDLLRRQADRMLELVDGFDS